MPMYVCMYVYMYVCMYVCIYVCMYECMYIWFGLKMNEYRKDVCGKESCMMLVFD